MTDDTRKWAILVTRTDKIGADLRAVSMDDPKKKSLPVLETSKPEKIRRFDTEADASEFERTMTKAALRHYTVTTL